jgi:2-polyprenyl-3-methyl-5-hydroxy-6-metoxy-1,4-benzoquinol methylase
MADPVELTRARDEVAQRCGPWTSHNIHLGGGVYTMGSDWAGTGPKIRRMVQSAVDLCGRPASALRVLDLACAEGLYAIEFGLQGAESLGIEGRAEHVERARFAAQALALPRTRFLCEDVRELSVERHGMFDVVLCLGILYHLDQPDVFAFLKNVAAVTRHVALFTTQVSTRPRAQVEFEGRTYSGAPFLEFLPGTQSGHKQAQVWASLDNMESFWLTRASLFNALVDSGFTSVYECRQPFDPLEFPDQPTIAAVRGTACRVQTQPRIDDRPPERFAERMTRRTHIGQNPGYRLARRIGQAVPAPLRGLGRILLGIRHPRPGKIGQTDS